MGNESQVIDMIGFECYNPSRKCLGALSSALEELSGENIDEDVIEEYTSLLSEYKYEDIYKKLKDYDKGLFTIMADECMNSGNMAIGWSIKSKPSKEKLEGLKEILENFGLRVTKLVKDRFCYYG